MPSRTLREIDADLKQVRQRMLDSPRESEKWKTAWVYIDRLLEERLAQANYSGKHARSE